MFIRNERFMSTIRVVIAIVSYKSAALTVDCLRSIDAERQSTAGVYINVIVVDNASGDAPAIAEGIRQNSWSSWVNLLVAPKNGGFAYGNNLAYQSVDAEHPPDYFYLLNPDTLLRKGAIGALVRFLEAHKDVGVAGSSFENRDGSEWPLAFRFPSIVSELETGLQLGAATRILRRWAVPVEMGPSPQRIDWVSGASMMIRASVFDALGGFDDNYFLYFEETDFCLRASRAGIPTWYVPESRVMHIAGQSTKVTEHNVAAKRLPPYWYESRRRYFVTSHGAAYAMVADIVSFAAHAVGAFKHRMQGRTDLTIPYFLTDLAHHSALWPRNRRLAARVPFPSRF